MLQLTLSRIPCLPHATRRLQPDEAGSTGTGQGTANVNLDSRSAGVRWYYVDIRSWFSLALALSFSLCQNAARPTAEHAHVRRCQRLFRAARGGNETDVSE